MYEGILVPTVLYGNEVWAASAEDRRRMGVIEMKCTRTMCGVSIRNEEVWRCGSELSIGE
jgi:hypothetical protein